MRTLEHVLSSRSAHPTQRDPLNFIAPSPSPYALLLSAADMYPTQARPYTGDGDATSPLPIWKAEMAAARQIARRLAPPSPPSVERARVRAGQAFELPFVPRLINFHGRHNRKPPPSKAKENTWRSERGREGSKGQESASRKTARARMIINGKLLSSMGKEGRGEGVY